MASWDGYKHTRARPTTNRPFFPKAHFRIVFKEVCCPVRAERALGVVFRTLRDGAEVTDEFLQFFGMTNLVVTQAKSERWAAQPCADLVTFFNP